MSQLMFTAGHGLRGGGMGVMCLRETILFSFIFQLTGVRVNNVFNDFIMLANTQFVENVSTIP